MKNEQSTLALLERAVERNPHKPALHFEGQDITFKQLDSTANQLANYIARKRTWEDIPICFCLNQSIEKVVVMLSIWKAGGAYVSLDPSYPIARLQHIIEDTNTPLLVTTKALSSNFDFFDGEIILIDEQEDAIREMSTDSLVLSDKNRLFYFAYTSGSTGVPKAVMAEDSGLANFIAHFGVFLNVEETDSVLNISSSSFDGIVLDLWVPLSLGITVFLYPDNRVVGEPLLQYIRDQEISVLPYLPVSILATLPMDQPIGRLRKVCTGGEAPIVPVIAYWRTKVELINIYGPTETTVVVAGFKFSDTHPIGTIGRPLSNVDFYVLDEHMNSLPVDEVGELYIGGVQVSRGYYKQPERTAERFLLYTTSEGKPTRVYKTGDLVRRLADDTIEFVGRADQQVKIRGYRVEPAEVEEHIRGSGVVENSVIVIKGEAQEKEMICFYIGKSAFPEDIRRYLYDRLPSYMIPSKFHAVASFPLTANGKIDKSVLRDMGNMEEERRSFVAPKTSLQEELANEWCNVLGRKSLGIYDNFFQYGGNSILAYRLISNVRKHLNIPLEAADLFLNPTIFNLEHFIITADFSERLEKRKIANQMPIYESAQQRSLRFIDQLHGSVAYHVGAIYPLAEDVDVRALENAIRSVIQEHHVLRTVVDNQLSTAQLRLLDERGWQLQVLPDKARLDTLLRIPFDLQRDFMIRAYVIFEQDKPNSLLLVVHHMATDGWSMPILVDEINSSYRQIIQGTERIEHSVEKSYYDYAVWQAHHNIEKGMHFWKGYLSEVPVLQLPHDFKKTALYHGSGKRLVFKVDQDLTRMLKDISAQQGATLYTTLLSAFGLLMQYYSSQSDICIGSPAANRPHDFDKTIGYFANMLPLRVRIEGNPTFSSLLKQNRDMLSEVFQYQYVPLDTIVSQVLTDRIAGYNPLFQHVFVLQDPVVPGSGLDLIQGGEVAWLFTGKTKFDLLFEAIPVGEELMFNVDYAEALFADSTIVEMMEGFQSILKAIASDPHRQVGTIQVHAGARQEALSYEEPAMYPKTLIRLFEEQVMAVPQHTALQLSGTKLSYQELDTQSSLIAEQLIAKGIKAGDFVACLQEQSLERVVTLLGILKAGAAYVPLDVSYPVERVSVILNDTQAKLCITTPSLFIFEEGINIPVLYVEEMLAAGVVQPRETYVDRCSPTDVAYVIHTSGTTGTPKGVLIEHRSLGNFITEYGALLELGTEDSTLQFSPYNFDGSVIDLWIPLSRGAMIHLYPNNKLLGDHLAQFIREHEITVIPFISPSVLSTLPSHFEFPPLKTIGTGAESCPIQVSNHWKDRVTLFNMYGPTEATVAVNRYVFSEEHPHNTIGVAIKHMHLYVLDQYLRPVPRGVTGELFISGIQLSRGYLNQPDLTAERFVKNPFAALEDGIYATMYKTGDQMRVLTDGMLEYVGRADHQVKVRGYRIELAEVETVLCQIPGVHHAVADVQGEAVKSLIAFVVTTLDDRDIKKELNKKLPPYMVPNQIFHVAHMPVKLNGKVDMEALRRLAVEKAMALDEENEEPANNYERIIRDVWSDVLQRTIPGMEEDFFYLGGHSLLLTKLYNKLFNHFPNKLTLSELYTNNTIRKLACLIEERYANPDFENYVLGTDPLSEELKRDATIEGDRFQFDVSCKGNFEDPEAILLTGVTGFVGINLLVELLASNKADIYLLIRAEDEEHAYQRLIEAMEDQWIPLSYYDADRIKLLAGDLAKPYFGLSGSTYHALTERIDVVYHAGSSVNFIQPYSYMKGANVDALHKLIQFVTTFKLKQLSLLSTVGVFSWEHHFTKPAIIKEDTDIASAFKYLSRDMGYIQSKWVMEQVAQEAIKQGVPIVIFRLGYVFCHSRTGATAKYQWWSSLIKTCVNLRCYPILVDQKEELTMVDFVCKAIAYISKNPKSIGEIFHLSPEPKDNMTVMDFFKFMQEEFGFDLKPVPYQEWMKMWEEDEDSPLYPLMNLFKFKVYDDKAIIEIHQNTPDFDISNTKKFLVGSRIENTTVQRRNVEAFCKYLGVL